MTLIDSEIRIALFRNVLHVLMASITEDILFYSGDLMGPSLANIDSLLKMPYGCGEQNMLNFAPNIFIMQYLQAIGQLTDEIKQKATDYTLQGAIFTHISMTQSVQFFNKHLYPQFRSHKLSLRTNICYLCKKHDMVKNT